MDSVIEYEGEVLPDGNLPQNNASLTTKGGEHRE